MIRTRVSKTDLGDAWTAGLRDQTNANGHLKSLIEQYAIDRIWIQLLDLPAIFPVAKLPKRAKEAVRHLLLLGACPFSRGFFFFLTLTITSIATFLVIFVCCFA